MSDAVLILSVAISFFSVLLIGLLVYKGLFKKKEDADAEVAVAPAARPIAARAGGEQGPRVVRQRRNVGARMRAGVAAARPEPESEDEDIDSLGDEIALPDGKIGAKKRKKLEMKAEKRAARERDLEEREERKQRQEQQEEMRKREEEKAKQEEAMKEEEEMRLKEEKEKQELEEYLKMKEAFAVEEEGYDENENDTEAQNKFQEFINYINTEKVVLLEELAAHFKLKTQECIDRVQALLEQEQLVGVIDDRGKFISITNEELQSVAKFIRQRGRVLISELVDSSNELIKLQTKESVPT